MTLAEGYDRESSELEGWDVFLGVAGRPERVGGGTDGGVVVRHAMQIPELRGDGSFLGWRGAAERRFGGTLLPGVDDGGRALRRKEDGCMDRGRGRVRSPPPPPLRQLGNVTPRRPQDRGTPMCGASRTMRVNRGNAWRVDVVGRWEERPHERMRKLEPRPVWRTRLENYLYLHIDEVCSRALGRQ